MDYMTTKIPGLSSIGLRAKNEKHKKFQEKMLIRDLPLVYGLFAIGMSSGIPIKNVIFEISKYFPDSCKQDFVNVIKEIESGMSIQKSLLNLESHPHFRALAHVISESSDCGTDVLPALDSLHRDSMNKIRRESDSAIKKLPVTMLFPLVVCILPAFLLLSVIPILINGFFNIGF